MNIWTLRAYSISIGEENMNVLIIISCICFLFICMRIFVVPIKLMVKLGINSILGIIFILIVNFIGIYFNFHIGINWITILIVRNFRSTRRNIYYIVKRKDNLTKIARKYKMTWQELYHKNKEIIGSNPNLIRVGQKLLIK